LTLKFTDILWYVKNYLVYLNIGLCPLNIHSMIHSLSLTVRGTIARKLNTWVDHSNHNRRTYSKGQLFRLICETPSPQIDHMFWFIKSRVGAWGSRFLISSQVMPMLVTDRLYFEQHALTFKEHEIYTQVCLTTKPMPWPFHQGLFKVLLAIECFPKTIC
jgi:hypothetical protein